MEGTDRLTAEQITLAVENGLFSGHSYYLSQAPLSDSELVLEAISEAGGATALFGGVMQWLTRLPPPQAVPQRKLTAVGHPPNRIVLGILQTTLQAPEMIPPRVTVPPLLQVPARGMCLPQS